LRYSCSGQWYCCLPPPFSHLTFPLFFLQILTTRPCAPVQASVHFFLDFVLVALVFPKDAGGLLLTTDLSCWLNGTSPRRNGRKCREFALFLFPASPCISCTPFLKTSVTIVNATPPHLPQFPLFFPAPPSFPFFCPLFRSNLHTLFKMERICYDPP